MTTIKTVSFVWNTISDKDHEGDDCGQTFEGGEGGRGGVVEGAAQPGVGAVGQGRQG